MGTLWNRALPRGVMNASDAAVDPDSRRVFKAKNLRGTSTARGFCAPSLGPARAGVGASHLH